MRRRTWLAGLLLPAAARAQEARLPVVATFSILADMAREVGGDAVTVASLMPPDGDVHLFQPGPAELRALRDARVLVENGLRLEGLTPQLVGASGFSGTRIVAAQGVEPLLIDQAAAPDPHVWHNPRHAARMVRVIAGGLAVADPARSDAHRARAGRYVARIEALDREIEQALAGIPPTHRRIVTSHDAFGYYGERYGVQVRGVQGISTLVEPSARDLARLARQVRRQGVRVVFPDVAAASPIAALAREAGARLGGRVYSDSLSPPGGPAATYLDMMRHNTALFAAAMRAR